jgi:eukaryotic-like serine/threonine-protein kinase
MDMRRIVPGLFVVLALLLTGCSLGGCVTKVPDVKGKTPAQAEAVLLAAGFKSGKVTYDESAQGAAGAVVAQDPAAGVSAAQGSVVNLTVAGPQPVKVPSVVGQTKETAIAALAATGLTLGDVTESFSTTAAPGAVIAQRPPAGSEAPSGSPVALTVSVGQQPVSVPAVVGKTYPDASAVLSRAGLKAAKTDKADSAPAGAVVDQSPSAGTKVAPGSTVTLVVSTGTPSAPAKVAVPSVKGLKLAAAQAKIEAAGLKWKQVLGPGDGMTDVGFVYKQVPTAGTLVYVDSTVACYSWTGP